MSKRDTFKQEKPKFWKRVKTWVCISITLLVVLLTTLIIFIILNLRDTNRSSYQVRNIDYTEIVKKNYIDGFKDTKSSGEFSYVMPEDDINELLHSGLKSLNNDHIENIYYKVDESGLRYFYVDLINVGIKTRVVILTTPSIKDESTITLSISSATIGKVNALNFLENRGYLTSQFINEYLYKCHLPIGYDQNSRSFEIKPYNWMKLFPESKLGNTIFSETKDIEGAYSLNSNLFGFNLDISKFSKGYEYIDVDTSDIPNVYEEVKTGCVTNFYDMNPDETRTVYSLSEENLNKMIKSSFVSTQKEEITSNYTSNKVVFDLLGSNVILDQEDKIKFRLFYSINGYVVSEESYLSYDTPSPSISFLAFFEKPLIEKTYINEAFINVLSSLTTEYDYLEFSGSNEVFSLNLSSLNNDFDLDLKYSEKSIVINPSSKSIDFRITK